MVANVLASLDNVFNLQRQEETSHGSCKIP